MSAEWWLIVAVTFTALAAFLAGLAAGMGLMLWVFRERE